MVYENSRGYIVYGSPEARQLMVTLGARWFMVTPGTRWFMIIPVARWFIVFPGGRYFMVPPWLDGNSRVYTVYVRSGAQRLDGLW